MSGNLQDSTIVSCSHWVKIGTGSTKQFPVWQGGCGSCSPSTRCNPKLLHFNHRLWTRLLSNQAEGSSLMSPVEIALVVS